MSTLEHMMSQLDILTKVSANFYAIQVRTKFPEKNMMPYYSIKLFMGNWKR